MPGLTETFPVKESYAIPSVRSFSTDRHTVSKSNILLLLCKNYTLTIIKVTHEHVLTTAGDYGLVIDRHHGNEVCRIVIVLN